MPCWTESRTGSVACQPGQLTRGLSNVNAHMSVTQFSRSGHVGWVNMALSSKQFRTKEGSPAMMTTAAPDKRPDPHPKKPVWGRKTLHH
jgi:hypothetical protein